MDFYNIKEKTVKQGLIEVYPDFRVARSQDLMIRGKQFYAIWDEEKGLWSTDEFDVQRLVDYDLYQYHAQMTDRLDTRVILKILGDWSTGSWLSFRNYVGHLSDSSHQLDEKLTFANTDVKKTDYVSRRLSYALEPGSIAAYDEVMSTLYSPQERAKLEWAIGALVAGDAKFIQKFIVLYGAAGKGKSTFLGIVQKLFDGYYTTFEAKALTSASNAFSTEVFKSNPLIAIQHDGDLSKIEDNSKLNSIVAHEDMMMNEKYKPSYTSRVNAFLFMGTNKPVKITDAKSGIIRRLIDVQPSGNTLPPRHYHALMGQIDFELGAIAQHCLEVYREMGKDYYSGYRPVEMMLQTDVFFNFVEAYYDIFTKQEGISLNQAYEMYKTFCMETNVEYKLARFKFREELKNYFRKFDERMIIDGVRVRSWYSDFIDDHFISSAAVEEHPYSLVLDNTDSVIDFDLQDQPAQYATDTGIPIAKWSTVETTLKDLDTTLMHYVKPPLNHIVIDFDLKGDDGEKSVEANLEAASKWPPTYAEYSQGGSGIHLHYLYDGDVSLLSRVYSEGIEIKVFTGDSSLRRRVSRCNTIPVATINSGIPLKERKVMTVDTIKSEKGLRELIEKNLRKEIHPGTKPSMDFIDKILRDAYESGLAYDVSDMYSRLMAFANHSSNQSLYCLKLLANMPLKSKEEIPAGDIPLAPAAFFDVEVFPNLFVVSWMYDGDDTTVVSMINPKPHEIEQLLKLRLIGFNNRRYDNHMLYAAMMGYDNLQLYKLSQRIINNVPHSYFGAAWNLSYADIYDYAATKMGLKKWQIVLGLHHQELGLPWDEPVPEERWLEVAGYCENDVRSTKATHHHLIEDFHAREILSEISRLPINETTQRHTAKIIFGDERSPQKDFVYTNLADMFEGYQFEQGKSTYKGIEVGEGGLVHGEPGMYTDVALLDVASMHPTSAIMLDIFGPYTKNFEALVKARVLIKRGDYETAGRMMGGVFKPYLKDKDSADKLAYALKIIINIVYGLTAAKFENPFHDMRNKDNIVAKRGALFMVDLLEFVNSRGFSVVHIKTDSIKIPNATPEIIEEVMEFGEQYGYEFEHEATYEKFCLVNDAVYIAYTYPGRKPAHWEAVGAQFQHPYVFKTLFTHEPLEFEDFCETKSVTTSLWLDFNGEDTPMALTEPRQFVGRVGQFVPVKQKDGGGTLLREKDGKFYAATGTKGYHWLESEVVRTLGWEDRIDTKYFEKLANAAIDKISEFGDYEWFVASND